MTTRNRGGRRLPAAAFAAALVMPAGLAAAEAPADTEWRSYNGTADGQRYADLDQINTQNAAGLKEVCRLKIDDSGAFHTGPLLVDGTLYLTTGHDTVAVDATTCTQRWRNNYSPQQADVFATNRGAAYANGRIFRGTPDGRLLAIDAATGKTVWDEQGADPRMGEFFGAAPIVWEGLIVEGTAGGDWGARGRIMAFDQATGREVWRFYTVPRGKDPGAESWKVPDTARYGGGGSWTHFSIDMSNGEIFVPVGNPAPDIVPGHRPGANLYTDSMVVLDVRTGALKWYHQMISNDGHDLDLGAAPMLYANKDGEPMVAIGSKNGHLYGVNRETHKRAFDTILTTIENEGVQATAAGLHICPGLMGGVEWNGPAYDHKTKSIIVGAVDWCATIKTAPITKYIPGQFMLGGTWTMDDKAAGWIEAVDPDTGAMRWRYHADSPVVAGITPTAGGVTFSGDMAGNFLVLDSATGLPLLKTPTGGAIAGGVITYLRGGTQYVAVTSGNVSRLTFGPYSGTPSIVVYALNGTGGGASAAPVSSRMAAGAPDAAAGKRLFVKNCAACHGANGEGGAGPRLQGIHDRKTEAEIVEWIKNPSAKMPKLYPSPLGEQDVVDLAAHVKGL